MSKMRQGFVWTDVYDTHLRQMKRSNNTCVEIADFINHNVSLRNEKNTYDIELITAQDVRDRYDFLQKPHTSEVQPATTTVKYITAPDVKKVGREKLIAVTLPLVPLRA